MCITLGPGEIESCRVSLFAHDKMEDNFYIDTKTGVIRTGVEGGSGALSSLSADHLLKPVHADQ